MGGFNAFNQQTVNDNGGVVWAKQAAQSMDPGAVESQVQAYQQAAIKLAEVQTALQNVKNNLASTWTGDAAEQALKSIQQSIDHAHTTQETITQAIIPPLQNVKVTQVAFMAEMALVPDEKPVPSTNAIEGGFDWATGQATPTQQAQAHNIQARYQAAELLNSLSESYDNSTNQLLAVGARTEGHLHTSSSTSAFDLGPVSSSSGDGAASGYSQQVSGGGATRTAGYAAGSTVTVASGSSTRVVSSPASATSMPSGSGSILPIGSTVTAGTTALLSPGPGSTWDATGSGATSTAPGSSSYSGGVITDELPGSGASGSGGGSLGNENVGKGRASSGNSVSDETSDGELNGGRGTGQHGNTSNNDSNTLGDESEGTNNGLIEDGQASETEMAGGTGQGMGVLGVGEEGYGTSQYSRRARYLGEIEESERTSLSPVRSVYEDATDAQGNRVNMMAPGRRGSAHDDDEEDERGQRPSYLKEDEFWSNAQRIVPPVIQ